MRIKYQYKTTYMGNWSWYLFDTIEELEAYIYPRMNESEKLEIREITIK